MRKSKILDKELQNSKRGIMDHLLLNANGAIDPASAGYQYVIDTLSFIRSKVISQKFYEVSIADFMSVDVGEAAFGSEIVQNLDIQTGGDFFQGDVSANSNQGRIANTGAFLQPVRMPTQLWLKATNWTVIEIKQAAALNRWDVVESKLRSLKKNWDLGIQEVAFLGHPMISTITGLINNSDVTINTSLITTSISEMTTDEYRTLIRGLLSAYWANSNNTALPDTFIIPTDDYLGLADPVSATYPNISKIEYLINTLQKMTGNPKFKVLPLAYCQSTRNASRGIEKNRYVLYRNDPETLSLSIPVDFTMLAADTSNQIQWQQGSYGQYSGVLMTKVPEILYFDETAVTT